MSEKRNNVELYDESLEKVDGGLQINNLVADAGKENLEVKKMPNILLCNINIFFFIYIFLQEIFLFFFRNAARHTLSYFTFRFSSFLV